MTKSELKEIIRECLYESGILYESNIIELGRGNSIDTTNIKSLRTKLVKIANSNKFKDKDYKAWSESYSKEKSEECKNKLPGYKLAYCLHDAGDDYIVYSFAKDRFFYFSHEQDGLSNIENGPKSLEWISKYIKEW